MPRGVPWGLVPHVRNRPFPGYPNPLLKCSVYVALTYIPVGGLFLGSVTEEVDSSPQSSGITTGEPATSYGSGYMTTLRIHDYTREQRLFPALPPYDAVVELARRRDQSLITPGCRAGRNRCRKWRGSPAPGNIAGRGQGQWGGRWGGSRAERDEGSESPSGPDCTRIRRRPTRSGKLESGRRMRRCRRHTLLDSS